MTELGRMHSLIPFKQLVEDFGLRRHGRHMCGRKHVFTPEGKDATCYESRMRYPTDAKLLWECIEKAYHHQGLPPTGQPLRQW